MGIRYVTQQREPPGGVRRCAGRAVSSLSCRPKGVCRVDSDGFSRYREALLLDGALSGCFFTKKSGTAEIFFVSFMQVFLLRKRDFFCSLLTPAKGRKTDEKF